MKRTALFAASVGAVLIALSAGTAPGTRAYVDRWQLIEEREAFGLPTDDETLAALEAGGDVGSAEVGISLTTAELLHLDLAGRMNFAVSLDDEFLPFLRSLPTYAGVWIDQPSNGAVVAMLTELDPTTVGALEERLPKSNRGLRVEVATHTYAQLVSGAAKLRTLWDALDIAAIAVGVDTPGNRLFVTVVSEDAPRARSKAEELTAQIDLPVEVRLGDVGHDAACTDREHCTNPMRAGIVIHRGSTTSNWYCTMSWHIHVGTDEQFLTAGHCGYGTPNQWFHQGFGATSIGTETATVYANGGKDAMRVGLYDSQASNLVYARSHDGLLGTGQSLPVVGEAVCVSLGKSDEPDCGTVHDDWLSWTSETANYTVWGGDTSGIYPIGGDSGSPLYTVHTVDGQTLVYPKGISTHENGYFARTTDVLDELGATILR
jgi:hypothetical protein